MRSPTLVALTFASALAALTASEGDAHAQYNPYYWQMQQQAAIVAEQQRQAWLAEQQRRAWLAEQQRQAYIAEQQRRAWLAQQAVTQTPLVDQTQHQRAAVQLQQAQTNEYAALWRAHHLIATAGWGPINARVQKVISQLRAFSGESFSVLPAQTFNWGQAHAGGVILFDVSSAAQADPILAFRLAHEWGHEALGHQANIYNPIGSTWRPRATATQFEDEADVYAGRFLFANGYDVAAVERALRQYPDITGDSHSGGTTRARLVRRGYDLERAARTAAEDADSDDDSD